VIVLSLPYPPTSNHNTMVANGRRISSPKYRAWRTLAELEARAARQLSVAGPYHIQYRVDRPDRRRRDIENLPKSLSDALQAAGIIEDDAHCETSFVAWTERKPGKGARVHITIIPYGVEP